MKTTKLKKNEFWVAIEKRFSLITIDDYSNLTLRKTKPELPDYFNVIKVRITEVK